VSEQTHLFIENGFDDFFLRGLELSENEALGAITLFLKSKKYIDFLKKFFILQKYKTLQC